MKTLKEFKEVTGLQRGVTAKELAFYVERYFRGVDIYESELVADIVAYYLIDAEEFIFTYENLI